MAIERITICPLCGGEDFELYSIAKDYTVTKEEFELKKCIRCKFIVTSPRPDSESIAKYYTSENYISHSGTSKTLFDKIYLAARNLTLTWKHKLIKEYFPKPAHLLDYGSGTGEFLNHMKNKGWNVLGLEPNKTARDKANLLVGNIVSQDLVNLNDNSIQVITLWHVLEHIHDLDSTILKLKRLLTPNGIIILALPNPNSRDSQFYKGKWAGYDVPRHLWHFTQETMTMLLNKNGLKLVAIKPMKLDSYYVSLLSEEYKNPGQSKLITAVKALLNGFVSNLSARKTKEYSSLIYIAKST